MNAELKIKLLHRITNSRNPSDWEKSLLNGNPQYIPKLIVARIMDLTAEELEQQLDFDKTLAHMSLLTGMSEDEVRQRLGLAPLVQPISLPPVAPTPIPPPAPPVTHFLPPAPSGRTRTRIPIPECEDFDPWSSEKMCMAYQYFRRRVEPELHGTEFARRHTVTPEQALRHYGLDAPGDLSVFLGILEQIDERLHREALMMGRRGRAQHSVGRPISHVGDVGVPLYPASRKAIVDLQGRPMRSDRFAYTNEELEQFRAESGPPRQLPEIIFPDMPRADMPERGSLGRIQSEEIEFDQFILKISSRTMKRLHDQHFGRFGFAGSFIFDSLSEKEGLLEHPEIAYMVEARINYLLTAASRVEGGFDTLVKMTSRGGKARLFAGRISIKSQWLIGWPSFIRKDEAEFLGVDESDLQRKKLGRGGHNSRSVLEITDSEILVPPTNWITLAVDVKEETIDGKPVIELGTIYPGEDIGPTVVDDTMRRHISEDVSEGDDGFILFPWDQKGRDIIQSL